MDPKRVPALGVLFSNGYCGVSNQKLLRVVTYNEIFKEG